MYTLPHGLWGRKKGRERVWSDDCLAKWFHLLMKAFFEVFQVQYFKYLNYLLQLISITIADNPSLTFVSSSLSQTVPWISAWITILSYINTHRENTELRAGRREMEAMVKLPHVTWSSSVTWVDCLVLVCSSCVYVALWRHLIYW